MAPIVLQGLLVVAHVVGQALADQLGVLGARELGDRHHERWVADDPGLALDLVGQLGQCAQAVLAPGLRRRLAQSLALGPVRYCDTRSSSRRAYQTSIVRIAAKLRIALRYARAVPRTASRRVAAAEPAIAAGDRDARGQALDVPFPGSRQALVEVVEVEDQPPIRRGEYAVVGEVRIAAQLRARAADRRVGEVGGHDRRRAAEEREGRAQHAAVADRHELGRPGAGLLDEDLDGIAAIHATTLRMPCHGIEVLPMHRLVRARSR